MRKQIGLALIAVGFLMSGLSSAASFDCTKASSPYEKAVCANPNLSSLDDQLAGAYKDARTKSSDPDGLKKQQLDWIKATRACGADTTCIEKSYKSRISELQGSGTVSTSASASTMSDSDIYKFYVKCYGVINMALIVEQGESETKKTFLRSVYAFDESAQEVGKKMGYQQTKINADLKSSSENYKKQFNGLDQKSNDAIQVIAKQHQQEMGLCVNKPKNEKQLGDLFYKNYNIAKSLR